MNNSKKLAFFLAVFAFFLWPIVFTNPALATCGIKDGIWSYCSDINDLSKSFPPPWVHCGFDHPLLPGKEACCNSQNECDALQAAPTPAKGPLPSVTPGPNLNPFEGVSSQTLKELNPLQIGGGKTIDDTAPSAYADELSSPGGIVSRLLDFALPIAGLILFVMLIWGGFEMLVGAPTGKSIDAGKQRVTAAIIGFLLLFSSYWLIQIIEVVFGVVIL